MDAPDRALAESAVVTRSKRSVVKVLGAAPTCSRRIEGFGFVYADGRVMTNAHVVAGTRDVAVETSDGRLEGKVVVHSILYSRSTIANGLFDADEASEVPPVRPPRPPLESWSPRSPKEVPSSCIAR